MHPRYRPLHDPAIPTQPLARLDLASRDSRDDAAVSVGFGPVSSPPYFAGTLEASSAVRDQSMVDAADLATNA